VEVKDSQTQTVRVTNINATSDDTCPCGSWLDHWKRSGGQLSTYCSEESCYQRPEVGARVQKDGGADWYIIPLCSIHGGMKGEALTVSDHVRLVPADVKKTCGKP
jgi:hypothetical protein